jgi:hypothetical protein
LILGFHKKVVISQVIAFSQLFIYKSSEPMDMSSYIEKGTFSYGCVIDLAMGRLS